MMQHDGNLVLYDYAGQPKWDSGTSGQSGSYLIVQDDGNVVIERTHAVFRAAALNLLAPGSSSHIAV
jgi:hypothetical protein